MNLILQAPGLAWEAVLKNTNVKLDTLTYIVMLLNVEKRIRGRIHDSIYCYAKDNNKYMIDSDKSNKQSS